MREIDNEAVAIDAACTEVKHDIPEDEMMRDLAPLGLWLAVRGMDALHALARPDRYRGLRVDGDDYDAMEALLASRGGTMPQLVHDLLAIGHLGTEG